MRRFGVAISAMLAGLVLGLAGCSDPTSDSAQERAAAADGPPIVESNAPRDYARSDRGARNEDAAERDGPDPRDVPAPLHEGRPMWSANSRYTAEENAERAFARHGEDFGARDADAYVAAAHDFVKAPPADVLTLTRTNGDKLYYAPGDNIFAVATREGAPRTFFKPEEGMAYWREQEEREASRGERRAERRPGRDDARG